MSNIAKSINEMSWSWVSPKLYSNKKPLTWCYRRKWLIIRSEWSDSNWRPLAPHASTLANCATPRSFECAKVNIISLYSNENAIHLKKKSYKEIILNLDENAPKGSLFARSNLSLDSVMPCCTSLIFPLNGIASV